jgi:hypothetical protein
MNLIVAKVASIFFGHPERSAEGAKSKDGDRLARSRRSFDCGSLCEPPLRMTKATITALSGNP